MANTFVIPSDPAARLKIKQAIKNACDALTIAASEKEEVKEIVTALYEEYKIPKAALNRLIRLQYDGTFDKKTVEEEDFQELYLAVATAK